jgi:hypothetical protein
MKTTLLPTAWLAALIFVTCSALAGTTNIYVEDWGTGNPNVIYNNGGLSSVGWTPVAVSQTTGPYVGIYTASPQPTDSATGESLPANTTYFSVLLPTQTNAGMMYTTDTGPGGAGPGGNSYFTTINNPNLKTNLTFSVEERNGGGSAGTNYFAVQVGAQWYVATSYIMPDSGALGFPLMTNATLVYTNPANVWNTLTINANDVTIGGVAALNTSSPITGVGIVITPTTGQPNFNRFAVQVLVPNPPPPNPPTNTYANPAQTVYEGGGVSLVTRFTGTLPLTYSWQTNGVPLPNAGKYSGVTNNTLTITNVALSDATANGITYSVTATNIGGVTNSSAGSLTLNVLSRPSDMLYYETLPYAGPSGNLQLAGVGWVTAFAPGASGGIFSINTATGQGADFDYSGFTTVATNASYTTYTNDTGASGLPFTPISIASYPTITFQAQFRPGNGPGGTPGAVTTYWSVRVDGNWYSSVQPIPIDLTAPSYFTNQYAFKTAATNWNNLTINGNVVTLGGVASSPLSGNIDGAGLVFVHNAVNTSMNFENFLITTNPVSILPPTIGTDGSPWNQTAASGGGVSFGVVATGTSPFTYGWTLNGVKLANGGRIFGATGPTLTIADVTTADNGTVVAFVTNAVGVDESDNYTPTTLTVTNPDVGVIYSEAFPFVGPLAGAYPISSVGWIEAAPGVPNALYQRIGGDGAVSAFNGSPATAAYYATTTTDTNQAGLPFPNINLAYYSDLSISVDIAPTNQSANVTAYVAVQLNGGPWYIAANPLPVPVGDTAAFTTYTMPFNPAAANWKNLTILGQGASIGSVASSKLTGIMTGAGVVFVYTGSGGTLDFDNFLITGTGLGGINAGRSGGVTLSWVGNPAVNLQSATNLIAPVFWQDVTNTLGAYSLTVSPNGPQKYFRLVKH